MARNKTTKVPQTNQAYRGYLLRVTLHGISIVHEGAHIGWARTLKEGKNIVDALIH